VINKAVLPLLGVAVLVGVALGMSLMRLPDLARPEPMVINTPVPPATALPTVTPQPIQVFVNGAVIAPDVYLLPPDGRIKQAIAAAGGFTKEANTAVVNLAQPLVDGAHIYVPARGEEMGVSQETVIQPAQAARSQTLDISGGSLININTADLDLLDELPGIGPATALKIIDYRNANGPFERVEGILEVSGIGEAKFEKIRDLITTGK
jgi:competence protein ComEA